MVVLVVGPEWAGVGSRHAPLSDVGLNECNGGRCASARAAGASNCCEPQVLASAARLGAVQGHTQGRRPGRAGCHTVARRCWIRPGEPASGAGGGGGRKFGLAPGVLAPHWPVARPAGAHTRIHTHTHTRSCDEMPTARAHILSGVLIRRRARRPPWGPISGRHRKLDTCRGRRAPAAASTLGRRHHLAAGPQAWRGRSRRPGCDRRHQVAPGRPIRTHARLPAGPVNTGAEWRPRRRCSVAVTSPTERHCGAVPSRDACVRAR